MSTKAPPANSNISVNKKARHEYFLEDQFEAGLVLQGWEVKSLRAARINFSESYVLLKDNEAWLFGCHISPLTTASTHITTDPIRTRKLLLNRKEISRLIGAREREGYTIVPVEIYWKQGRVKLKIALAKGKKLHDKRADSKNRDWQRQKQHLMKKSLQG